MRFFAQYIFLLYENIPRYVYESMLAILVIATAVAIASKGFRKGVRFASGLALAEYVALLFCSTVIFRVSSETVAGHNFHPFWSYRAIMDGKEQLIPENIMNVVVFVPVGLLAGLAFRKMTWWRIILIGLGISVSIETLQFILQRGFAEFDDVFHNTLGCMIGYLLSNIIRYGRTYAK